MRWRSSVIAIPSQSSYSLWRFEPHGWPALSRVREWKTDEGSGSHERLNAEYMGSLVVWWLVLEGLGLMALPLTFRLFSARAGHGYVFGKVIGLLLVSYVAWLSGFAGMPFAAALWSAVALFAGLNAVLAWQGRAALAAWARSSALRTILIQDALWTAGFLYFAWQRSLWPPIVDQEKYMDFAFFNTLQRTNVMPPEDPWMSGMPFNYYYFGYLMFANLARLVGLPSFVSYNLCVATIGGLAFAELAAIGLTLTRRLSLAVLTGAMGILLGNLDGFLQLVETGGLTAFNYFRSTRIIGGDSTINEFPYFTTIHGDLHPHFLVLPVQILLLGLLLDPERFRNVGERGFKSFRDLWPFVPVTFVLGTMVAISIWELPVAAMTTFLLMQRHLSMRPLLTWRRLQLGVASVVMVGVGYVLYLPFYLHFVAPPSGVGAKVATTSLREFFIVFGALLAAPALYLVAKVGPKLSVRPDLRQLVGALVALVVVVAYLAGNAVLVVLLALVAATLVAIDAADDGDGRAPLLLILAASVALLACELVYLKDPYGDRLYRMNTVFKLYLQAWVLLSIAGPWCVLQLFDRAWLARPARRAALVTVGSLLLASCAYPVGVTATRVVHRMSAPTLDGNEYLQREHPDDFAAIQWIRGHVTGLPVILEASGNPYSYYARFSSNTGLPTIMGWANHEGLWRGHETAVGKRHNDVLAMYNAATLEEITPLLDQYHVKYIVVGELERKDYPEAGLQKFNTLRVVFTRGDTTIYER
jgi:YYY domain-containing protein